MDDRTFRTAMGKFATGVTIVTTKVGEDIHGMTANAFMSVSLDPKLILISIDEKATMKRYIDHSNQFAISILNDQQKDMSAYFAGQKKEMKEVDFHWFNGMPTIDGALVKLTCDVDNSVVAGDHTLYIGKVTDVAITEGEPLAFFEGKYRKMEDYSNIKE
ncbi:flavin reductase family protein [Ornithinibacillus halophilus]|uniref:NADH-FMN oxidoreductase RutF, flavin reductase (DIM6/NTAB) family n=1 Tax=Ornithinibacillus halophilus TaxID=930117 RepID=A0A1M5JTI6_9BACI|nr:flavin reductase family protein [Ornithinibacillus halophilus]SHG43580.1 NADH-FMN oxidoreductase RutF, flavin reductase (DIM6/NTAB) family [Ornithinibacillus halophilus]